MNEASFDKILPAARRGEPGAMETLYLWLAPGVIGYLRGEGAAEPEDLASEVFVGMVRNLRTFQGEERGFRSWVFSIAYRRLMDERRAAARKPVHPVDPVALAKSLEGTRLGDVEEEALARLGDRRTAELLAKLTVDQRTIVLLRIVGDLAVEEVARIVEKSEGAVKSLQRRALAALAREIQPEAVS
jgi:RNA polymerase sigma factor (sigma-70 family)